MRQAVQYKRYMTSQTAAFSMRLTAEDAEVFDRIEDWRATQKPIPSKKEAVMRLLEIALDAERLKPGLLIAAEDKSPYDVEKPKEEG